MSKTVYLTLVRSGNTVIYSDKRAATRLFSLSVSTAATPAFFEKINTDDPMSKDATIYQKLKAPFPYFGGKLAKAHTNENRHRECLYFSPHCLRVGQAMPLFAEVQP